MKPILTRWAFIMANEIIDPLYYDVVLRETILKLIRYVLDEDKAGLLKLISTIEQIALNMDNKLIQLTIKETSINTQLQSMKDTEANVIKLLAEIQKERLNGL